jgi:hypothetical protein
VAQGHDARVNPRHPPYEALSLTPPSVGERDKPGATRTMKAWLSAGWAEPAVNERGQANGGAGDPLQTPVQQLGSALRYPARLASHAQSSRHSASAPQGRVPWGQVVLQHRLPLTRSNDPRQCGAAAATACFCAHCKGLRTPRRHGFAALVRSILCDCFLCPALSLLMLDFYGRLGLLNYEDGEYYIGTWKLDKKDGIGVGCRRRSNFRFRSLALPAA